MIIKYQIFENEGLLIQKFIGTFSIETYVRYSRLFMESTSTISINKVLIDFRNLDFGRIPNEMPDDYANVIDKMTEIRKNIFKNDIKRKDIIHVFLVDKPLPTVIAHLFTRNFPDLKYHYCATTDNVIKLINISKSANELINLINNLENTFEG